MPDKITQHIEVTKQDITSGVRRQHDLCPVALAVRRAFDTISVSVAGDVRVVAGGQRTLWNLDDTARQAIAMFDADLSIEPFEFDLTYVEEDD